LEGLQLLLQAGQLRRLTSRLVVAPVLAFGLLATTLVGRAFGDDIAPVADCVGGVCLSAHSPALPPDAEVDLTAAHESTKFVFCSYRPLPAGEVAELELVSPHDGQRGGWFYNPCRSGDGRNLRQWQGPVWVTFPAAGPTPLIDPGALAQEAYRLLPIPTPRLGTNPPPSRSQLVNIATWLWVERSTWGARTATVSVPGESVTATATPRQVIWSMGDGHTVLCDGAGTPYEEGRSPSGQQPTCSYTYERSSAGELGDQFSVRATVTWLVTWSAVGVTPSSGQLPPLQRSGQLSLTVGEAEALN
jgi:hypothetical protein